ncbi:MAG: UDP-N-acetylmuramoyl-L-alanine--D-glutamate ligase [Bacteroidales bacterium]|nr:UDP-N-acetylmuramoyl-L-alanine--D-glutamate ligase [Bacteroidales bacterium]
MQPDFIINKLDGKKIIILGYGREGSSSYHFLRRHFPSMHITVADKSETLKQEEVSKDPNVTMITGDEYDRNLNEYDFILKSPGISFSKLDYLVETERITSQTDLFLQEFHAQVVGITGTKGKSTTASLIYHLFKEAGRDTILAGNIGVPLFDIIDKMTPQTVVVAELSAHQLEFLHRSPDYAVLLNIYQEHLDHFNSFNNYQIAKINIARFQEERQFFVYNGDNQLIEDLIDSYDLNRNRVIFGTERHSGIYAMCDDHVVRFYNGKTLLDEYDLTDHTHLPGRHNYFNIMAAIAVARHFNLTQEQILNGLSSFRGLPHRLELVGKFKDITFYNDSISTIPEAAIAAVKALRRVDTLILGGYDRGIDYTSLIEFLGENPIRNVVFTGPAGERILNEWKTTTSLPLPENILEENDFQKIVLFAFQHTKPNKIALLSPAAASYNQFKNFEERGDLFKKYILEYAKDQNL